MKRIYITLLVICCLVFELVTPVTAVEYFAQTAQTSETETETTESELTSETETETTESEPTSETETETTENEPTSETETETTESEPTSETETETTESEPTSETETETEAAATEFYYEDEEITLKITLGEGKTLPAGTQLYVADSSAMTEQLAQQLQEEETSEGQWLTRDICFVCGGEIVDTANLFMTAEVSMKEKVVASSRALATAGKKALEVVMWQIDEEANILPLDHALFAAEDSVPVLRAQVQNGTLILKTGETANPEYTVQYYAYLYRASKAATDAAHTVEIIDTRGNGDGTGGNLPKNNVTKGGENPKYEMQKSVKIPLRQVDGNRTTSKNNGNATPLYQIDTQKTLVEVYTKGTYRYIEAPNTAYVNKLPKDSGYELEEVWVLKENGNSASTASGDWTVYDAADVHFTNRKEFADKNSNVIYVTDSTVIRLVYAGTNGSLTTSAVFYDYDITAGKSGNYWITAESGINSPGNYGISANGKIGWSSKKNALAFGNNNMGTQLGKYRFIQEKDFGTLNAGNANNIQLCTFELVTGLEEGKLVYNEWIIAPNLFNDGTAVGKHTYDDSKLEFKRVGDSYTLSKASANGLGTIEELEYLFNPSPNKSKTHDKIFTNDFWPMDKATDKTDPIFGANGDTANKYGETENFPVSDDGNAHNSYFGMQYALTFELSKDYIGPLDYTFFGDDDMWVFLDDKLICDIGGVHSAVGEYVDLWDYLKKGDGGKHTLTFFYTERGASGSTCYMNFTLPSVTGLDIEQKTGDLKIAKKLLDGDETHKDKEFTFNIHFSDANGNAIWDDYVYDKYDSAGKLLGSNLIICDGDSFTLKDGEYIQIEHLPYGLKYEITEVTETPDAGTGTAGAETSQTAANGIADAGTLGTKKDEYQVSWEVNGASLSSATITGTIAKPINGVSGGVAVSIVCTNTIKPVLTLEKQVKGNESQGEFGFEIAYKMGNADPTKQTVLLASGEASNIDIPYGAEVTIKELQHDGFYVMFYEDGKSEAISALNGSCTFVMTKSVKIIAVNQSGYELPATGGEGTMPYRMTGILLLIAVCSILWIKGRNYEREE